MTSPRALSAFIAFVLIMTACGSGDSVETSTASDSESAGANPSVIEVGEQNQSLLETADDVRDIQVLDVGDGSIATLRDAADGDRPVLLWFFAPH